MKYGGKLPAASYGAMERLRAALPDVEWVDFGGALWEQRLVKSPAEIGYLEREHGDLIPYYRGLKRVFDPNGILNPGKVLPPEA